MRDQDRSPLPFRQGHPEKFHIITMEGAFHGRTIATIAAGGQEKYLEGFGPKAPGFDQVPFGDLDAVKAAITDATAGILVEPVQGEGGIRPIPVEMLKALRAICDEHGLLLILDECSAASAVPASCLPMNGPASRPISWLCQGHRWRFPAWRLPGDRRGRLRHEARHHGSTYGGNPLAMAVGNAVLDVVLAEGFLDHVRDVALVFRQGLASLSDRYPDVIEEVRGEGLMLGMKAKVPNTELLMAMRDEHLLGVPAGDNVIRLLPPLTVSAAEAREGIARIERAAEHIRAKAAVTA